MHEWSQKKIRLFWSSRGWTTATLQAGVAVQACFAAKVFYLFFLAFSQLIVLKAPIDAAPSSFSNRWSFSPHKTEFVLWLTLARRRHKTLIVAGVNSAAASVIAASPLLSPPAPYIFCPLPPGHLSFQNLSLGLEGYDKSFYLFHGLGMFRELVVLCDDRKPQKNKKK